jgi:hypothetical protein
MNRRKLPRRYKWTGEALWVLAMLAGGIWIADFAMPQAVGLWCYTVRDFSLLGLRPIAKSGFKTR